MTKVSKLADEDLTPKPARERQTAMLQELLKKYPDDFHVRQRYQAQRRFAVDSDRNALAAEYRAELEKNPNDPVSFYLYLRLLVGHKTKEAIEHFETLVQRSPEFPWSHLELAKIYSYPNFRDPARSSANLRKWMVKCPTAMDGFYLLSRSGDKELMAEGAKGLRARLEASAADVDLRDWEELWTLEFKLRPVAEHPQVRQRIAEDLKRLRAKGLGTQKWLSALHAGYKVTDDKEGRRWAEDEMLRLFPQSSATRWLIQRRWEDEHPYPQSDDAPEKKQAHYRALLSVTDDWIRLWPDDWSAWSSRFNAVAELENTTGAEIEAAGEQYLKAMAKNGGEVVMTPPPPTIVARAYAKRGVGTDRIPTLVQRGLQEMKRRPTRRGDSDLYPHDEDGGDNLTFVRWQSWPILAEAYAKLKRLDKSRQVLAEMSDALAKEKPAADAKQSVKMGHAQSHVTYWQTTAKVAEAEGRKLDAMTAYQTALSFRPKSEAPKVGKKDELANNAHRLWTELGGTAEGWTAYLARNAAARKAAEVAEAATWDAKRQPLPDFDLTDLQGKAWRLSDLKGKVAFINVWATWCGPCKWELPYVQKLSDQMKDSKDTLVLTFNIDDELGLLEPFMKENKYSFTVIPAENYVEEFLGAVSIPRNWVVSADGALQFEGIGFGSDGDEWMNTALKMIEKAKGGT